MGLWVDLARWKYRLHIWSQIKQALILERAIRFECLERLVSWRQKGGGDAFVACLTVLMAFFASRLIGILDLPTQTVQNLCRLLSPLASV